MSILTGPDAGEWFPVAQQVAGSESTLELLMQDPLPQFPDEEPYTIEITYGNYVDDSFIGNSIDLTNMVSTGIDVGSNSFGVRIIGNDIIGGSSVDGVITGVGIAISVASNNAGGGEYPMPGGWTDLPDLGAIVEGNIIQNAIEGIAITPGSSVSTGRTYLTATIVDNVIGWTASFLSQWFAEYSLGNDGTDTQLPNHPGNNPADPRANQYPPTIMVGYGFQPDGYFDAGDYRTPQTVGGYNDQYQPTGFVDPSETVLTIENNQTINPDAATYPEGSNTGQIYVGIVNGTEYDPVITPILFNGFPYYLFNYLNLNIVNGDADTQGLQAMSLGQDNYDLVGAGSGSPDPDGTQDLHFQLTGLSTTATISSITITDNANSEGWVYPESGSSPQIVFDYGAGSTTADIFIQPNAAIYDGSFTIDVTYAGESPIAIPVDGVTFDPYLPVVSSVPQAPVDLSATPLTSSEVSLSWTAVPGATYYELERWPASDPSQVTTIDVTATGAATMSSVDTGLAGNTPYDYQILAVSPGSLNGIGYTVESPMSLLVTATTLPVDALTLTGVSWSTTVGAPWTGTVATFSDVNTLTSAGSFSVTVNWGDDTSSPGSVSGSGGSFTITAGSHTYASAGNYTVTVQVDLASASINDTTSDTASVTPSSSAPAPAQVDLSTAGSSGGTVFNAYGITTAGSSDQNGLNYYNYSYLSTALGSSVNWDGQTFDFGAADTPNVFNTGGASIYPAQGSYTNLLILGGAVLGTQSVQITVFYTNNTSTIYDQDFSDWMGGYTGPGTTAPGESIVETLHSYDEQSQDGEVTTSGTVYLYGYNIPLDPSLTVSRIDFNNNVNQFILAVDMVNEPPQINMATSDNGGSSFNAYGITADDVSIPSVADYQSGLNNGDAFSATELGTSVTWDGQTFNFGAADTADVYAVNGRPIDLPENDYTNLLILGMAVNGVQYETITVVYADGQQVVYNQDFSDWTNGYTGPDTTAPGESIVETMHYYDDASGNKVNTTAYLYGYNLPLNPNEPVSYVYFDNNNNANILAVDVVNDPTQVNLEAPGSSTGIASAFNDAAISMDNQGSYDSISHTADSFSANQLGTTVSWDGQTFNIGPAGPGANDVYLADSQPIYLPENEYTNLLILGTAINNTESATITVDYVDGTSETYYQDFSDWLNGYNGTPGTTAPGESIVETLDHYNTSDNGETSQKVYIYGYNIPLNPDEPVSSVTFNNNNNEIVFAIDVVNSGAPQVNLGLPGSEPGVATAFNNDTTGINAGITVDSATQYGSLDGQADSYSATALGDTVTWDGETFDVGGAAAPDVHYADGSQVNLPVGDYTNLLVLGAATGVQPIAVTVVYTDGTQVTFDQDFSDWVTGYDGTGGSTAPGESIADTMTYRNYYDWSEGEGGKQYYPDGDDVYVYGYNFPIDPAKTVSYVTFSDLNGESSKAWVLAIDVVNQPSQVNLGLPSGTAAGQTSFNEVGITLNGSSQYDGQPEGFNDGLDGEGDTYSANLLGTTMDFGGQTFNIGQAAVPDVSFLNGSSIQSVEVGSYEELILLGAFAGTGTGTLGITVNYTSGYEQTFSSILGNWLSGSPGPDGYTADTMDYYNNSSSGKVESDSYVYGYFFTLEAGLTISSISFSGDPGLFILAADLVPPQAYTAGPASAEGAVTVYGGFVTGQALEFQVSLYNDAYQLDTSYNGNVTVSLGNNPGGSTLGGTLTVQAQGGVATFDGLTVNNPGIGYTLDFWPQGFGQGPIVSDSFDVAGYSLVANSSGETLVWNGTSGDDDVQFVQVGTTSTVAVYLTELDGVTDVPGITGLLTEVPDVTAVVVNEYDGYYSSDVIDCSGLGSIPASITAGNGSDIILGGGAANTIVAGNGADTILGGGGPNSIIAGNGDDVIYGNGEGNSPNTSTADPDNTIAVGDGNDIIYGNYSGTGYKGGSNTITAGNGSDVIYGDYGNGGALTGDGAEGDSSNVITVGNGNDTVYGNYGTADGGEGGDNVITAGNGNDVIYGTANGNSTAAGQCGSNVINVGNGNDTIYGNMGGDGGEGGDNIIVTGSGNDVIYGNFGGDGAEGGYNLIVAGGGNDTIYAHCGTYDSSASNTTAGGFDLIIGGSGADTVYGWPSGYTMGSTTGDIFIAGTVNLNETALEHVLAEWDSTDSYATRVAVLSGDDGPYSPGGDGDDDDGDDYTGYLIEGMTIIPSSAVDVIFGTDADDDWYLVTSNDQLNNVDLSDVTWLD